MIKIEHLDVWGFEHAVRGMRNPKNSWDKSDSKTCLGKEFTDCTVDTVNCPRKNDNDFDYDIFCIGKNDMSLMNRLFNGGTEHRKFMRQIMVSMDITAPLYWWKEFDTYKVGTVADSCSTMHKIHAKAFTLGDFSHEHLEGIYLFQLIDLMNILNDARSKYLQTKDKNFWWQLIQLLPSSYNQKRTITMNYEVAYRMIEQRSTHKLDEWREFVKILAELPYLDEMCRGDK